MITIRKLSRHHKKNRFTLSVYSTLAAILVLVVPIFCDAQSMTMQGMAVEECRIVDEHGLTLAVERGTQEHFSVVFTFSEGSKGTGQLSLIDIGGSGGTKKGALDAAGQIQLKEVGPGTWQLVERPKGAALLSVRIY